MKVVRLPLGQRFVTTEGVILYGRPEPQTSLCSIA